MTSSFGTPERLIIAEVGSVHDGSFGNACKLIELAARCGANVVKFQTHIAEAETLRNAPSPPYFSGEPRFEYFQRTSFTLDQWKALKYHATRHSILFLSSPFSLEAVDLLEAIGLEAYKVPSGEVTNSPLLERLAATGKTVLLSSGMSDWAELDRAVALLRRSAAPVMIMQCASRYPAPPEQYGLNVIAEMRDRYGLPVGYSDHSVGLAAPIAAAALGAAAIEKHLTFSKAMYGSDAANAMEPETFSTMAAALNEVWDATAAPVDKNDLSLFLDMKKIFEKSVVTSRAIPAGTRIGSDDIAFKKPGSGFPAWRYQELLGQSAKRDLPAHHMISEEDLS